MRTPEESATARDDAAKALRGSGRRSRSARAGPRAPTPRPGRPERAEPAAPGEGVSGGRGAAPLPVPLAAPPHAARPGRGAPRTPSPSPATPPATPPGTMQSRLLLLGTPGGLDGRAARRVRLLLRQAVRGRPGGDRWRPEVRLLHAGAGADSGNPGTPRAPPPPPASLRAQPRCRRRAPPRREPLAARAELGVPGLIQQPEGSAPRFPMTWNSAAPSPLCCVHPSPPPLKC